MKFMIDERVKHRLTGMVVILSIAAIFIPAVVKKSNHHFEENVNLSVRLPVKPALPNVIITGEKELFHSVKIAKVVIPSIVEAPHAVQVAKAEPLSRKSVVPAAPTVGKALAKVELVVAPVKLATAAPKKVLKSVAPKKASLALKSVATKKESLALKSVVIKKVSVTPKLAAIKKEQYAVQLASFMQQKNAQTLVTILRGKGYIASYNKFSGKQGEYYKVFVGQLQQKNEAITLQKKLALSMQLNGFIVKTGVS